MAGPGGRIVQSDVEGAVPAAVAASPSAAPVDAPKPGEVIPVKGMRKTIASRMHHSLMESAQLTMDMTSPGPSFADATFGSMAH